MEDVLDVYHRPRDPECPVVCLDETSKQLIAETRVPIAAKPGRPARIDYEYERNGTANIFMLFAPLEGWRHVEVTDRHTAVDYAHLAQAKCRHVVSECAEDRARSGQSQHPKPASRRSSPPLAGRAPPGYTRGYEWHYTPKHGSWQHGGD